MYSCILCHFVIQFFVDHEMGKKNRKKIGLGLLLLIIIFYITVFYRASTYAKEWTEKEDVSSQSYSRSEPICLDDGCIQKEALALSRPYPRNVLKNWCIKDPSDLSEATGLILTKIPKAASSTSAGVSLRVAFNHICHGVQWVHQSGYKHIQIRDPASSFLWTTIRDPASRAVSTIQYHVLSRRPELQENITAVAETLYTHVRLNRHLHHGAMSVQSGVGFSLQYAAQNWSRLDIDSPHSHSEFVDMAYIKDLVELVMRSYDFVAVAERMEESMVLLSLLWNVSVGDVLVTSSKTNGYHELHAGNGEYICVPTHGVDGMTPKLSSFLSSRKWRHYNYGDYLWYAAAWASINKTIDETIGREAFDIALAEYRRIKALAESHCASKIDFPCSSTGQPQDTDSCYAKHYDFGCGYRCIDAVLRDYSRGDSK